jgi:hypothetical protein
VVSLFVVKHQGSAQGGKAEGSKLPEAKYSKVSPAFQITKRNQAQFSL